MNNQHPPLPGNHSQQAWPLFSLASLAVVALVSCLLVVDALTHAKPLVLPALSVALTVAGFSWAVATALRHRPRNVPLSDMMLGPGLIVFFGFAAAMLSDADQVVKYLQIR